METEAPSFFLISTDKVYERWARRRGANGFIPKDDRDALGAFGRQYEGEIVWIVDDTLHSAETTKSCLEEQGAQTRVFASGPEMLEALKGAEEKPAAILCDVRMPEMGGFDILKILRLPKDS
jgi:PleD family two-component response regulator